MGERELLPVRPSVSPLVFFKSVHTLLFPTTWMGNSFALFARPGVENLDTFCSASNSFLLDCAMEIFLLCPHNTTAFNDRDWTQFCPNVYKTCSTWCTQPQRLFALLPAFFSQQQCGVCSPIMAASWTTTETELGFV